MLRLKKFINRCFWALLSLMVTLVIFLGAVYCYMEINLPNVSVLKDMHMQQPLRIYTRDGKLITQYGAKRRIPVTIDQVPPLLVKAILATEDARYFSHPGVDFLGLLRAAKVVISSGRKVQGASTITMQVARNFFLSREKTYTRKIKEILLALKIDKELSKEKVLELYLNKVYFGKRAYGVAAAAQVYYGKTLDQLTLPEMAMIAGLPQAPSRNNPLNRPKQALERRNHVLSRMLEVGFIDKATYEKAIKASLTASYHGPSSEISAPYIAEMTRRVLIAEYGQKAYEMGLKVYTTIDSSIQQNASKALQNGLIAYSERHGYYKSSKNLGTPTEENRQQWVNFLNQYRHVDALKAAAVLTVGDKEVQALLGNGSVITIPWQGLEWARPTLRDGYYGAKPTNAHTIVSVGDFIWILHNPKGYWQLSQVPKVQGALIALNPQNGGILALVGGFDFHLSKYNRATQAQRQPGSNFKPFVYSAALAKGLTLATIVNDAPVVIRDTGENQYWRPGNDNMKFYGPTRLRVGLTKSRNLVSIRLLQTIGIPYALNYIRRFGFNSQQLPRSLSLALGTGLMTPLEIALGYAVFANGGYRVTSYFVDSIVDQKGKVLYSANMPKACEPCVMDDKIPPEQMPQPLAPQVISVQNAYLMTNALQGVIQEGTGKEARILKRNDLSGKTGTTNNKVDAWFSGYNSDIVATVWVGFDNLSSLHEYGAQAALPIWIDFMREALANKPEKSLSQPTDIVTVRIDPNTGLLANPNQSNSVFEVFRKNFEPKNTAPETAVTPYSAPISGSGSNSRTSAPTKAPAPDAAVGGDQLF